MKKHLLPKTLFRSALLSLFALANTNAFACTGFDLEFTSLVVTGIVSPTQTTYRYTIKNIGTQSVAVKFIYIQNYVTPAPTTAGEQAAGGSDLNPYSTDTIQPGATYSGTYGSYPFPGHGPNTDPYIISTISYYDSNNPNVNDCDLSNNSTFVCLLPNPSIDSLDITSVDITNGSTSLNLGIQNAGIDTLFMDSLIVYNYLSADSAFDATTAIANDTLILNAFKQPYLTQNASFSTQITISPTVSTTTYPYLITILHYSGAVCGPADSINISRIPSSITTGITPSYANASGINLYPNPATNVINISNLPANATQISIADIAGKPVKTAQTTSSLLTISLDNVTAGMYFYTVTDNNGAVIYSSKFCVAQ